MIEQRYYQIQLVQDILDSISTGYKRILVVAPVGSGKSILTGMILSNLSVLYNYNNNLIVEPFTNLVTQMSTVVNQFKLKPNITTYQGALKHHSTDVLVLDEAQHVGSDTGKSIVDSLGYKLLIGLTATPYRTDNCPLLSQNGGVFDTLVNGPTIQELTNARYLANIRYYSYPLEEVCETQDVTKDNDIYSSVTYEYTRIPDKEDNIVDDYVANFSEMSALAFARTVDHAKSIVHKFDSSGIHADYMSCYRSQTENKQALDGLKRGYIKVLAACNIASEGLDVPRVKLAIMARPIKKALGLQIQQIGRIMRPYQNEVAKVWDLVGNIHRIGDVSTLYESVEIK